MALRAAPEGPIQLAIVRQRKADRRSEADELRMEVIAAGMEMEAMGRRIVNQLEAGDVRAAYHFASRLVVLGGLYADPNHGGPDAA